MPLTPQELEARRVRWEILYHGWLGHQWRELYKKLTGRTWSNAAC